MKKIFVLGSLNMDLVITSPREIHSGETLHGSNFLTNPGGKGANQATACGKLGGNIRMCGCVGSDSFGDTLINNLIKAMVNTDHIRKIDGVSTGVAVIVIVNGDNRIVLDSGANMCVSEADVDSFLADAEEGDIFLTQLENPISIVGYSLRTAKQKKMTTILNPAPSDPSVREFLPFVDYFTPNEHELADLTGDDCIMNGAKALMDAGVKNVIVTLGSKGYCFYNGKELISEECIKMEVVDTTAAGDTFCGALAVKLAAGESSLEALRFANKASALTVRKHGAQQAIPTLKEYIDYYKEELLCSV